MAKLRAGTKKRFVRKTNKRRFNKKDVIMRSKMGKMARGPFSKFNDINPFPTNYNCKLVYACDDELTTSATARLVGSGYTFRLNSPFDPYTGTLPSTMNKSAYGFEHLLSATGPYQRYKVNGVKIDCTFYDPDAGADGVACVAHIVQPSTVVSVFGKDAGVLSSIPSVIVRHISDSGSQRRKFSQYFPMHQLYNVSDLQFRAETSNYTGPYDNNTGTPVHLELSAANMDASTAVTVKFRLKITYYVQCYDRYHSLTGVS